MGKKIIRLKRMKKLCCIKKKKVCKGIPGKLYGYMSLCRKVLNEKPKTEEVKALPFIGEILEKTKYSGMKYACLGFLKY